MNKEYIYLAGGFVAGLLIAVAVFTLVPQNGMRTGNTADAMSKSLESKTGDDFDVAFIDTMIVHHEGAINMANIAKVNAKHEEIKKMADNIISAQTSEINMMNTWKKEWYGDAE